MTALPTAYIADMTRALRTAVLATDRPDLDRLLRCRLGKPSTLHLLFADLRDVPQSSDNSETASSTISYESR